MRGTVVGDWTINHQSISIDCSLYITPVLNANPNHAAGRGNTCSLGDIAVTCTASGSCPEEYGRPQCDSESTITISGVKTFDVDSPAGYNDGGKNRGRGRCRADETHPAGGHFASDQSDLAGGTRTAGDAYDSGRRCQGWTIGSGRGTGRTNG